MKYSMVTCWALNGWAEHMGSKIVTVDATQLGAMRKIFERTRYTVRILDDVGVVEIGNALAWVKCHSDFSAFSEREVDEAIAFNARCARRRNPYVRSRYASGHDRRSCPTLAALRKVR